MGEHADDAIENGIHEMSLYDEMLDRGEFDWEWEFEFGCHGPIRLPKLKTCKHCKKTGLHWLNTGKGWRLTEDGKTPHSCPEYRPPAFYKANQQTN